MTLSKEALRDKANMWMKLDNSTGHDIQLQEWLAKEDWENLADTLGMRLEFGTAGLRGVVGPGPNRMNRGMVQQTSLGIAHYVDELQLPKTVIIGYDARTTSRQFAKDVADVLHTEGFEVLLFKNICTTPLLSFSVTWTQSTIGIMITASHNPAPDNGFKVYWGNGAQIVPPHDVAIAESIERISTTPIWETHLNPVLKHQAPPLKLRTQYHESIQAQRCLNAIAPCTFVYTAMHGVGFAAVQQAISSTIHTCIPVPSQVEPDGTFPTTPFPNPEEHGALDEAIQVALDNKISVVLANDPDADRLAIAIPTPSDPTVFQRLTGDQTGLILAQYLLKNRAITKDTLVANTIVSSSQLGQIADDFGVQYAATLTGFKWLANLSLNHQKTTDEVMLLGYEEALGYSVGSLVNDKDGISALLLMADAIGHYQAQGKTLWDILDELALTYGLGLSSQKSFRFEGITGPKKMADIMERFRNSPFSSLADSKVQRTEDYLVGVAKYADGRTEALTLPSSNVLVYWLNNQERVIIRPSGTEPKINFYFEVIRPVSNLDEIPTIRTLVESRLEALWKALRERL